MADAPAPPQESILTGYGNPWTVFFHVFFKGAALTWYVICSLFTSSFILHFVICVVLIAFDFWTVKNVSGRRLVGMRWWNETDEEGESLWRFESLDQQSMEQLSKKDGWLFWWTLYITPALWIVLGAIALIKFQFDYLLIVAVAVVLGVSNIIGFTKCRKDAKKQIQSFSQQVMAAGLQHSFNSALGV
eukprot:TRINITY_DN18349_c0_g1_i1.p1 TRINITY_DN18349_c0_g1~~TRINITY_DN18349_c0_g1_i1.p1  ORF type:complete len:188 (+),score=32.95 TRINITY_DN18349_c0_g1_i1:373-936(+)